MVPIERNEIVFKCFSLVSMALYISFPSLKTGHFINQEQAGVSQHETKIIYRDLEPLNEPLDG